MVFGIIAAGIVGGAVGGLISFDNSVEGGGEGDLHLGYSESIPGNYTDTYKFILPKISDGVYDLTGKMIYTHETRGNKNDEHRVDDKYTLTQDDLTKIQYIIMYSIDKYNHLTSHNLKKEDIVAYSDIQYNYVKNDFQGDRLYSANNKKDNRIDRGNLNIELLTDKQLDSSVYYLRIDGGRLLLKKKIAARFF